jgi:hypothetical protein
MGNGTAEPAAHRPSVHAKIGMVDAHRFTNRVNLVAMPVVPVVQPVSRYPVLYGTWAKHA